MTKTLAPAKTPGVAVARVLRGLGLKQGLDFGVRAERKNGERIGTRVAVFGRQANQTVADNADLIERLAAEAGFSFNVSVYVTPSGIVWVHIANYGERTRQTHFLSARPAEPVTTVDTAEDAKAKTLRDRAVALADQQPEAERPKPVIRATLAAPRPAFGQPEAAPADPYAGLVKREMSGLVWGCLEVGQQWFYQTIEHGPRYKLRNYLGRAYTPGWYLSGPGLGSDSPGLGSDSFMAGSLSVAAARAAYVIEQFGPLVRAMNGAVTDWPKGQRVQGVDSQNVTCMGTVNGAGWGAVTLPGHPNYGRAWVDVTWDEMPHNRAGGRRSRPFTANLIKR